jgi:AcrR family transcriptional regulator
MTKKRLHPADRNNEILTAAIKVAGKPGGYSKLTRAAVAECAGCSEGLIYK